MDCSYVVVPFERIGDRIGPRQAFMFAAPVQAKFAARQIAARVAGVAVLERRTDPETGDESDTVLAEYGAVPPGFPSGANWSLRLS